MAGHTHLSRRNGRYYFYRRIPKEVLEAFPGRQFIKVTLGTADYEEAKRKVREVSCEWDRRFDHERRKLTGLYDEIDEARAEEFAARWLEHAAWRDEFDRQTRTATDTELETLDDMATFERVRYREALAKGDRGAAEELVRVVERTEGLNVERGSISHGILSMALLRAAIEAMEITEARNRGEWVKPSLAAPNAAITSAPTDDSAPLSEIFEGWTRERKPPKKLASESTKAVRRFTELHGDLPVAAITRRHVSKFKDALLSLPARPSKALRALPVPELLKRMEGDSDVERLSPASVKKDLGVIHTLLACAIANGHRSDNPATGVKVRVAKNAGPRRLPYDVDDLKRIFASGVFTNGERPQGGGGEAAYWLPLLAPFTGARLEELGQLLASDVRQDGEVWYLDINTKDAGKRLKTASSERKVPLHPELVRLGFVAYADSRRKKGDGSKLFPDLNKDRSDVLTGNWSKWWGRYQREAIGIADRRKVFHSFRHSFKDACREAGIEEAKSDALTGHSGGGVGRSYGQGYSVAVLHEAVQRICYEGLDLLSIFAGD